MRNNPNSKTTRLPSPAISTGENATIRVGRISYLNVDPIYYGLENGLKPSWIRVTSAPPSTLNRLMGEEKLDISPVSTGAYAHYQDKWLILPDLSISCHGSVMSVLLASNFPLDDLNDRRVLITSESGTAVLLLKLIFAIRGIKPRMQSGFVDEESLSANRPDAVMIIGDKALSGKWGQKYAYLMDLGDVWYELTRLPIVFAVWAVRKSFARHHPDRVMQMIDLFRCSARMGQKNMVEIITRGTGRLNLGKKAMRAYFNAMEYDLDETKQRALATFFDGLHKYGLLEKAVKLAFVTGDL